MHIHIIPTIGIILIIVILWVLLRKLPVPEIVRYIAYCVMAALAIIWVADAFGVFSLGGAITVN